MLPLNSVILAVLKCFRQIFTALNCGYISTLTSFPVTSWDIELKLSLFMSLKFATRKWDKTDKLFIFTWIHASHAACKGIQCNVFKFSFECSLNKCCHNRETLLSSVRFCEWDSFFEFENIIHSLQKWLFLKPGLSSWSWTLKNMG